MRENDLKHWIQVDADRQWSWISDIEAKIYRVYSSWHRLYCCVQPHLSDV